MDEAVVCVCGARAVGSFGALLCAGWRWSAMAHGWLCRMCARATADVRGEK